MTKASHTRRSLDHAIVKAVAWTGAASWVAQGLTWVSTLLVVRILTPDDYGLVTLAVLYLGLATMLSEFGIGTAVVTLRDLSPRQLAELNSVALLLAVLALLLSWSLALPLALLLESPRLVLLVQVMSVGQVITALASVPTALLQKALRFRFLAGAQVVQSLAAAASTLILALLGGGYWALALGPLVGHLFMTLMVVTQMRCGFAWPDWTALRPTLVFSRRVILERLCWYAYTGSDRFIIGKWISEAAVGYYAVASSFGMLAVEKVSVLMLRVAPAAFSEVQGDPASLRRYLLSMTEGLAILTFPISIGIALVANDGVHLLFGDRWAGAIAPLQLLALFAAYNSVLVLLSRVLSAIGEVRFLLRVGVFTLAVMPIAFLLGTRWSLAGVAGVWVVVYPVTQLPLFLRLHRLIQLGAWEYLRALWPAVSAVSLMALGIVTLRRWPAVDGLPRLTNLVLTIGVGAACYALTILLFHADRVRRFRVLMGEIRSSSKPGRSEPVTAPSPVAPSNLLP